MKTCMGYLLASGADYAAYLFPPPHRQTFGFQKNLWWKEFGLGPLLLVTWR